MINFITKIIFSLVTHMISKNLERFFEYEARLQQVENQYLRDYAPEFQKSPVPVVCKQLQ